MKWRRLTLASWLGVIPVGFCGIHALDGIGGPWRLQSIPREAREGGQRPWAVIWVCGGHVAMCQERGETAILFKG